jgi:hypothetical protein
VDLAASSRLNAHPRFAITKQAADLLLGLNPAIGRATPVRFFKDSIE